MSLCPNVLVIGILSSEERKILSNRLNKDVNLYFYDDDIDIHKKYVKNKINVIVTIDPNGCSNFKETMKLSYNFRSKWVHVSTINDIQLNNIFCCYLTNNKSLEIPLVSVCTTISKSSEKIIRSFNSLKDQTYTNWEWIIIHKSSDKLLSTLSSEDPRIRLYNTDNLNNACKLSNGDIILQLDHGDQLIDTYIDTIVNTFKQYPDSDFIYTDYSEINENTNYSIKHEEGFCSGYGGYYKQKYKDRILNVVRSMNITPKTIRSILCSPRYTRIWSKSFYDKIGGHNESLLSGKDYELFIRTFLKGKIIKIPSLGYLRYVNTNGEDSLKSFQDRMNWFYSKKLCSKFREFKVNDKSKDSPNKNIWTDDHLKIDKYCNDVCRKDLVSIVIPTFKRRVALKRAIDSILSQTYQNFEICIVGDKCPELDTTMLEYDDIRIKWWNLETNSKDSGATPRNYAVKMMVTGNYVAYLDDDDYWLSNHLESLMNCFKENPMITYAFGSFQMGDYPIIVSEPKLYRVTTSAMIHKYELLEKYGYWSPFLYAHDWDIASRWVKQNEPYGISKPITMIYEVNPKHVNAKNIYCAYGDQIDLNLVKSISPLESINLIDDPNKALFAITTLTYNDRSSLIKVIDSLTKELIKTKIIIKWYLLLQHCSGGFIANVKKALSNLPDNVIYNLMIYEENLGLSHANNILIEKTKCFKYVLHVEDDWILLENRVKSNDHPSWIDMCVAYMELNKDLSTIFLRAYNNEKEKWQYGWTRTIPYVCHKHPNNFNFEAKMKDLVPDIFSGNKFTEIPTFMFSFNPCIRRNEDYHKTVFPLVEFDKDQKDENKNIHWGWCEAVSMEKIRHLKAVWLNQGIFGHYEDWIQDLD
jgi:glycosyltransferase involved in cell wall biosynthesis